MGFKDKAECHEHLKQVFDGLAPSRARYLCRNRCYHSLLQKEFGYWIPSGHRVLEVGCGLGDLLASTNPARGVGLDLSPEMIRTARERHPQPNLTFLAGAIEDFPAEDEVFDSIILSDLVCFLYDIKEVFSRLQSFCHPRTRIVMNFHSRLWEPILSVTQKLRLTSGRPVLNWVTREDVEGMLRLAGFEPIWTSERILLPLGLPLIEPMSNRFLAHLWPLKHLCVTNVVVARPTGPPFDRADPPIVSVVVACRNEAGNIPKIVERVPEMGAGTELIFVEGGSTDDTWDQCLKIQKAHPDRSIQVHKQTGTGKGDAVRLGFDKASGRILMILDADMTVPPEDLVHFYEALASGRVEFVNGSRLVYSMDERAMRFLNVIGNKFFASAFSFLLGQRLKDTLCGTKVLLRSDYEKIAAGRSYFGDLDPFGDFDLIFGAAKLGLKIQDLPIRYRDRTYGDTNISRFSHGLLLLRMVWLALRRLKCR
ncbi:MAG: glycosyltransferase [Thermoanaerobaculales bacterium]|nr:glycosyltransferase [Thermoanaerobaculales bacterium]